jgi:hypothetical protein
MCVSILKVGRFEWCVNVNEFSLVFPSGKANFAVHRLGRVKSRDQLLFSPVVHDKTCLSLRKSLVHDVCHRCVIFEGGKLDKTCGKDPGHGSPMPGRRSPKDHQTPPKLCRQLATQSPASTSQVPLPNREHPAWRESGLEPLLGPLTLRGLRLCHEAEGVSDHGPWSVGPA